MFCAWLAHTPWAGWLAGLAGSNDDDISPFRSSYFLALYSPLRAGGGGGLDKSDRPVVVLN
jgi:hypothetical protein